MSKNVILRTRRRILFAASLGLLGLTNRAKEVSQNLTARCAKASFDDLDAVIESGVLADGVQGAYRAGLGVACTVNNSGNARIDQHTRTHRTGFQRDEDGTIVQPPATQNFGRPFDGDQLGVRCRVLPTLTAIEAACDDLTPVYDHGTYGDLTQRLGVACFLEGQCHEGFVTFHGYCLCYDVQQKRNALSSVSSAPGRVRTSNLWFRRPLLYPIELQVQLPASKFLTGKLRGG